MAGEAHVCAVWGAVHPEKGTQVSGAGGGHCPVSVLSRYAACVTRLCGVSSSLELANSFPLLPTFRSRWCHISDSSEWEEAWDEDYHARGRVNKSAEKWAKEVRQRQLCCLAKLTETA